MVSTFICVRTLSSAVCWRINRLPESCDLSLCLLLFSLLTTCPIPLCPSWGVEYIVLIVEVDGSTVASKRLIVPLVIL
jgi:hypothetical protein